MVKSNKDPLHLGRILVGDTWYSPLVCEKSKEFSVPLEGSNVVILGRFYLV